MQYKFAAADATKNTMMKTLSRAHARVHRDGAAADGIDVPGSGSGDARGDANSGSSGKTSYIVVREPVLNTAHEMILMHFRHRVSSGTIAALRSRFRARSRLLARDHPPPAVVGSVGDGVIFLIGIIF
jgi:hypothetical protein